MNKHQNDRVLVDSTHVQDMFLLGPLFRFIARCYIFFTGWKLVGDVPDENKVVAVVGPHTSNWDFPIFISMALAKDIRFRYFGKDKLFEGRAGWLFRVLGGIPVSRGTQQASDLVNSAVAAFDARQKMILGIAPEGTRSGDGSWKTGFYRIAVAANVPIMLIYLDAPKKEVGIQGLFYPTGDMEADIAELKTFYASKQGIKPSAKKF